MPNSKDEFGVLSTGHIMQNLLQRMTAFWRAETWLLVSVFLVAALLLAFGLIADEVMEGSTTALDQSIILLFRSGSDNLSGPIGPPWVREMARTLQRWAASPCSGSCRSSWWHICFSRGHVRQLCWCWPPFSAA